MNDKNLFLPALADSAVNLEDLAYACRNLESHDWQTIDASVQRGHELIQACAKDPEQFKQCIKAIGAALQVQAYYGYQFYTKKIYDEILHKTYEYILPVTYLSAENEPLPGIALCENALYVCRLFEKIIHDGIQNGLFQEEFSAHYKTLFPQSDEKEKLSLEEQIRSLYSVTDLIPLMEVPIVNEDEYNLDEDNDEDVNIQTNVQGTSLMVYEPPWMHIDEEVLAEKLFFAYRACEASYQLGRKIEPEQIIAACLKNAEILFHCLEMLEHVFHHLEQHDYQYEKQYYPGIGYLYTIKDHPDLEFPIGEAALSAGKLFEHLYKDGYGNEAIKETFRARVDDIMQNYEHAAKLPNFAKLFHSCVDFEKKPAGTPLQKIQSTPEKSIQTHIPLHKVVYRLMNPQPKSLSSLLIPMLLSFLTVFINAIDPKKHPLSDVAENHTNHSIENHFRSKF